MCGPSPKLRVSRGGGPLVTLTIRGSPSTTETRRARGARDGQRELDPKPHQYSREAVAISLRSFSKTSPSARTIRCPRHQTSSRACARNRSRGSGRPRPSRTEQNSTVRCGARGRGDGDEQQKRFRLARVRRHGRVCSMSGAAAKSRSANRREATESCASGREKREPCRNSKATKSG